MNKTLKYIKRKNIDVEKYDSCIQLAQNSRVYALSWYLDSVSDTWDVLVFGDYQAVMPIPFLRIKRYFWFKKGIQPDFCQQLGVFYQDSLEESVFKIFFDEFLKLEVKSYSFNTGNQLFLDNKMDLFQTKVNYELDLHSDYQSLVSNYSKNTKRNIKKAMNNNFVIAYDCDVQDLIRLKKSNKIHRIKNSLYKKMKKLIEVIVEKGFGQFVGVRYRKELIAISFIINFNSRSILLFTASTIFGKKHGAAAFLNDYLIQKYAKTLQILDFEGSMVPGIARFFKSFGATKKSYFLYKK